MKEARGLEKADLVKILGSIEVAEAILNKEREINLEQAKVLGTFFHVDSSLFLG